MSTNVDHDDDDDDLLQVKQYKRNSLPASWVNTIQMNYVLCDA